MQVIFRATSNFLTVLFCWLPGFRRAPLHTAPSDMLTGLVAALLAQVAGHYALYFEASMDSLRYGAGTVLLYVGAGIIALTLLRRGAHSGEIAVGLLWAMVIAAGMTTATYLAAPPQDWGQWVLRGLAPSLAPPALFLICRLGPVPGSVVGLAFALPSALLLLEWMHYAAAPEAEVPTETAAYALPDTEYIYAAQPRLLAAETDHLRPSDPNRVELFAVLGAGYAYERVFRREVDAVGRILNASFDAKERVVSLVNARDDWMGHPLLNRVNLEASLAAVGQAMGPEDVVLVFLTSHGGPGRFSVRTPNLIAHDITPGDLDQALRQAGIQNAIVIVSACYSGSFVDHLADPNRLVLTASAADRNSFGCSDENEWTDWGRAFFVKALAETKDPRQAARIARDLVADWESEQGLTGSMPQIREGALIGPVLDAWLADLSEGVSVADVLAEVAQDRPQFASHSGE